MSTLLASTVGVAGDPVDAHQHDAATKGARTPAREPTTPAAPPDLSARARTGKASFYAARFSGRRMADGHLMDPYADNASSKTLPLGTTAKVTNLETGLSAEVTIEDRGPYVRGRIVDLSPATAREIGIDRHQGVAKVVVAPIEVPLPDGRLKHGTAANGGPARPPLAADAAH